MAYEVTAVLRIARQHGYEVTSTGDFIPDLSSTPGNRTTGTQMVTRSSLGRTGHAPPHSPLLSHFYQIC